MKKALFSIIFSLFINTGFSMGMPTKTPVSKVKEIHLQKNGLVIVNKFNGPTILTIVACNKTGTFTFSSEFTLAQIASMIDSIIDEFCHTGSCESL
jgi:hypothetical protein